MKLEDIDIYGVQIQLHYQKNGLYQSKLGAIVTIIISCLILIQVFLSGLELIVKQNPIVISSEQFTHFPERYTFTKEGFNFGLGVQFPVNQTHFIDESIYKMSASMFTMKNELNPTTNQYKQNWKEKKLSVHPCKNDDFQVKATANGFANLPFMKDLYCMEYPDGEDIYMEGNYDQESFGYLQLFFHVCEDSPKCRPPQELLSLLTNSYVAIYSNDVIINAQNLNPFETIQRDWYWSASPTMTKDAFLYFRNAYVQSDYGLLFEQMTKDHSITFSYTNEQTVFAPSKYFFSITLRFETSKQSLFIRTYKKLGNVLADIGGIAKALVMVGFFICVPINKVKFHKQLSNSLFTYGKKDDQSYKHNLGQTFKEIIQTNNEQIRPTTMNNLATSRTKVQTTADLYQNMNLSKKLSHLDISPPISSQKGLKKLKSGISKSTYINGNQKENSPADQALSINQNPQSYEAIQKEKEVDKCELIENLQKQGSTFQKNKSLIDVIKISKQIAMFKQNTSKDTQTQFEKSNDENVQNNNQQHSEQINFSFIEYIKYYIWPWGEFKKKKEQIDYSVDKIYEHLDVKFIIQKLLEIEKLKELLLDENQMKLFQFFPKPVIDIDEVNKEKEKYQESKYIIPQVIDDHQQNSKSNIRLQNKLKRKKQEINLLRKISDEKLATKNAYTSLTNILRKNHITDMDMKIIDMIDNKILHKIDKNAEYFLKEMKEKKESAETKNLKEIQFIFEEDQQSQKQNEQIETSSLKNIDNKAISERQELQNESFDLEQSINLNQVPGENQMPNSVQLPSAKYKSKIQILQQDIQNKQQQKLESDIYITKQDNCVSANNN